MSFSADVVARLHSWRAAPRSRHWLGASSVSLASMVSLATLAPGTRIAEPARLDALSAAGPPVSSLIQPEVVAAQATTTSAPTSTTVASPPPPPPPAPALPAGKGMWLHRFEDAAGGDANAIVAQAKAAGLTHVYIRLGSSKRGFYAQQDLERLLPIAHAAGLKVVGWDFPYLADPEADARRSFAEAAYTTAGGHRIDAFAADIETAAEGTVLADVTVSHYSDRLRQLVGPGYPLIAAVPRYNPTRAYPYGLMAKFFDAFAPMVYWINRDPATDVAGTVDALNVLGKPVIPVGQAYDPSVDGMDQYPTPGQAQIDAFIKTAAARGVTGVSFWSWSTANAEQWHAIASDRSFG